MEQEFTDKQIISRYRVFGNQFSSAPTVLSTDDKIIEIYKSVSLAFKEVALQRTELLSIQTLDYIILKFLQAHEMMDINMFDAHLNYELKKYLREGLRREYQIGIEI